MITLAIAAAFFYFTRQNYTIFNGYTGFNLVVPPQLFGVDWRQPMPFYYLTLGWAVMSYFAVVYVSRAPFGLALQGVRDNPRRMAALGFNVTAHRVAAYTFAVVIAAIGGILLVWQNAQIAPGTAGIPAVIDILVIAVIGGIAPADRAVHRRADLRALADLLARRALAVWPVGRALQAADRPWLSWRSCSSRPTGCWGFGNAGVQSGRGKDPLTGEGGMTRSTRASVGGAEPASGR
jgi:hypothetical protein